MIFPSIGAGKIRFSGERNSMLLKASSRAHCAPSDVTRYKRLPYHVPRRAPNEIDYRNV